MTEYQLDTSGWGSSGSSTSAEPSSYSVTLQSVGTTSFNLYPAGSSQGSPTCYLEATVDVSGRVSQDVTVNWYFGSHKVASRSASIDPLLNSSKTLQAQFDWSNSSLSPGNYTLSAQTSYYGQQSVQYGTMHLHGSIDASKVSITGCPNPGTLAPSKVSTLDVTVSNQNSTAASVNIQILTASGLDIGSATATVSANSSQTVSVSYAAPTSPGSYDLSANVASVSPA